MTIDATLRELETILYGRNYAVFLHIYHLPVVPGGTTTHYITQALPEADIGGTLPVSAQELLAEVEESVRYPGDAGAGPLPTALASPRFADLLRTMLVYLTHAVAGATTITSFWLKHGHPAYPVFWDFAFVIEGVHHVEIVVGSSSD